MFFYLDSYTIVQLNLLFLAFMWRLVKDHMLDKQINVPTIGVIFHYEQC